MLLILILISVSILCDITTQIVNVNAQVFAVYKALSIIRLQQVWIVNAKCYYFTLQYTNAPP